MNTRRGMRALAVAAALLAASCGAPEQAKAPAPEIAVYQLQPRVVPLYQEFVGQVFGLEDISVLARVEGFLRKIHFREGRMVRKGDLLYTIESQAYEAKVAAALSELARARTLAANAKTELNRIRPLAKSKAISQMDLDAAITRYKAAQASVRAARAQLAAARIQLGYTKVHAPITGIIGKTRAKVGDFVGRSPNPIVLNVVSRIDAVRVEFYLPEAKYLEFYRAWKAHGGGTAKAEDYLTLILADGTELPDKGHIKFIDREVDPATGAILVQAVFPNPTGILRPGLFARVRAEVRKVKNAVLVPQRSVQEVQGRRSVYVVDENGVVHARAIRTGAAIGSFWLVTEGLKGDERIVYEALQKVRSGMRIRPTPAPAKTREEGASPEQAPDAAHG